MSQRTKELATIVLIFLCLSFVVGAGVYAFTYGIV